MSQKQKQSDSIWVSGLAINLVSTLISFMVGTVVAYLSHVGSGWVAPILCGGAAWVLTFALIIGYRVMKRLPPMADQITNENAGERIRGWMDEFNMTVQRINEPDTHFAFLVTTDGGKKIAVLRTKDHFRDYVTFRAIISPTEEEKKVLDQLTEDEKVTARLSIQMELSRAVVGFKTEGILDGLIVFKRIPITSTLTAQEVFNAIWEIEAVVLSVYIIGVMTVHKYNMRVSKRS